MSMLDDEFDWPNRKQRLFESKPPQRGEGAKPAASARSSAHEFFDHMADQQWDYVYREGWFWGGENLARDIIQQEALKELDPERDFYGLYLPMLYCYRHYLEVSLKHFISVLDRLSGIAIEIDLTQHHGLMPLWNEAERHAMKVFGELRKGGDNTRKSVERLLNEFHQFDPDSTTFRYRRDKHGRPQEDSIPECDLSELIKVIRGLRNYFQGCEDYLWEMESNMPDYRDEMPNESYE